MNAPQPLVPTEVSARAQRLGPLSFGFGSRSFLMLLLGLLWLLPAWWLPRLIAGMILWDVVAVAMFVTDLLRLPKPSQLEGSRIWERAPSLAIASNVTIAIRNSGRVAIRCYLLDETPTALRGSPPLLELIAAAGGQSQARYQILPRQRGDVRLGRLFLRYQSKFGFAERWASAEIPQTVRVFPDLEEARQQALYLIRSRQVEMEKRRRRQRGHGREFESLRDYREGDDSRDICWTATARRHQLTTRVFEIERSQAIWIVVDAGRLLRAEVEQDGSEMRLSKLDYAVNAALSLA
ncbi:MAG: DUF58 domain-containing protein, partial [Candidatus Acidiferrales bacterium]